MTLTLTLIPADLRLHSNVHYNSRGKKKKKSASFELKKNSKCKGVPDKEHVFSHLKWAISSRVNVKEGFGECSPSTSLFPSLGITAL